MSACISTMGHLRHHDEERHPDTCVRCGSGMAPKPRPLPEITEEVFTLLAETLEASGDKSRDLPCPEFDHLKLATMQRVNWGQREYGDGWRDRDLSLEAREELNDLVAYVAGKIGSSDHPRPHLWSALVGAFRVYRELLQDDAAEKGTP